MLSRGSARENVVPIEFLRDPPKGTKELLEAVEEMKAERKKLEAAVRKAGGVKKMDANLAKSQTALEQAHLEAADLVAKAEETAAGLLRAHDLRTQAALTKLKEDQEAVAAKESAMSLAITQASAAEVKAKEAVLVADQREKAADGKIKTANKKYDEAKAELKRLRGVAAEITSLVG